MSKINRFAIGFIYTLSYFLMLGKGYYFKTNSKTLLIVGVSMMLILLIINKCQKNSLFTILKLEKCPKMLIKISSLILMMVLLGEVIRIIYHFGNICSVVYQSNTYMIILIMSIFIMIYFQKITISKIFKLFFRFFCFILIVISLIFSIGFNNMELIPLLSIPLNFNGVFETSGMIVVIGYLLFWVEKNERYNVLWGSLIGVVVLSIIFYINESVFLNLNQDILYSTIKLGSTYNLGNVISNVDILMAVTFFIIEIFKISLLYRLILKLYLNIMEKNEHISVFVIFTIILFVSTSLLIPSHLPLFIQLEGIINLFYILGGVIFLLIF